MSFNIRYDNPNDNENNWNFRKAEIIEMLQNYQPDIIGIQEALYNQIQYIDSSLVNYNYVGLGREDGKQKGEFTALFFNSEKLQLISTKTYWLSETPNSVSVGWDAALERIVTYGSFLNKQTNNTINVFNCHFDHLGVEARENSAKLILNLIKQKKIKKQKIVVMGDLNCKPNDKPITLFEQKLEDTFKISKNKPNKPTGTFNSFNPNVTATKRIDYIFTKNIKVIQYITITDKRKNGLCLSDHYPVFIKTE